MKQLFKRLFNPFSLARHDYKRNAVKEAVANEKKTVLDLFRLDLKNLPLHDFIEGKVEVNVNGDIIQTYFKDLDYKECGIFDKVIVKLTGNKSVNVIFRSSEPAMVEDHKLSSVIDSLYDIYGQDNNNRGLYGAPASEVPDQQFYVLFGRNWMDYPKYKYPVSVRRYSEEVFLSVWGSTHQEMPAVQ